MNNNPAWQGILDKLPADLHKLVIPAFEEWDKGVQERFDEINKEYEAYKPFKQFVDNNVAADFAWQAVVFADELQREPAKVAAQINEAFELGLIDKTSMEQVLADAQAQAGNNDDDGDLFNEDKVDLAKNPEFLAMQKTLEALQGGEEEKRRLATEQEELDEFNTELDELEKSVTDEGKPFNRMFVTALMAQHVSKEEAVKQFHTLLAGNITPGETDGTTNSTDAPVTMGNSGNVGGGQADGSVDYSSMKTSEFNENIAKILEAQQQGN